MIILLPTPKGENNFFYNLYKRLSKKEIRELIDEKIRHEYEHEQI